MLANQVPVQTLRDVVERNARLHGEELHLIFPGAFGTVHGGIRVAQGHDASHVGDAEVVVVSSAVRATNAEVLEAGRRQIPVIPRAEMLARHWSSWPRFAQPALI